MIHHEGTKDTKDTKSASAIQYPANTIPQNLDIEIEQYANEQAFVTFVAFVPSW